MPVATQSDHLRISTKAKAAVQILLDLIVPRVCANCQQPLTLTLDNAQPVLCASCFSRMPTVAYQADRSDLNFPVFSGGFYGAVPHSYTGKLGATLPLQSLVTGYKYRGQRELDLLLGQVLARSILLAIQMIQQEPNRIVLVPVPSHADRQRGWHPQLKLITKAQEIMAVATGRSLPIASRLLRFSNSQKQAQLGRYRRQKNIFNNISVRSKLIPWHKSLILVDDVLSTGATLAAAYHALSAHGIRPIGAAVLAENIKVS